MNNSTQTGNSNNVQSIQANNMGDSNQSPINGNKNNTAKDNSSVSVVKNSRKKRKRSGKYCPHCNFLWRNLLKNPTQENCFRHMDRCMQKGQRLIKCTECDEEKYSGEFSRNWTCRNTLLPQCKKCRTDKARRSRMGNLKRHYSEYQTSARVRNLQFELSCDQFEEMVKQVCYYCGGRSEGKIFNGIDRISNNEGYILDNCVSCCKGCNYAKGTKSEEAYIRKSAEVTFYCLNYVDQELLLLIYRHLRNKFH